MGKKLILEALKDNPDFEKRIIESLKSNDSVLKKLKVGNLISVSIPQVIDVVKDDVRKQLVKMGEDVKDEPDFEKELYDKIEDLSENNPVFFQNLGDESNKEKAVLQLIKELT